MGSNLASEQYAELFCSEQNIFISDSKNKDMCLVMYVSEGKGNSKGRMWNKGRGIPFEGGRTVGAQSGFITSSF